MPPPPMAARTKRPAVTTKKPDLSRTDTQSAMTRGPAETVHARTQVGNAAVKAALGGGLPRGAPTAWTAQMMLAGQDLVGNQAVVSGTVVSPAPAPAVPGERPAAGQPKPKPALGKPKAVAPPAPKPEVKDKDKPADRPDKGEKKAAAIGPRSPAADPKFQALKKDVNAKKKTVGSSHPPAAAEAGSAQAAAEAPADDQEARGKAAHAEDMDAAKPKEFNKQEFVAAVKKAVADRAPKNLDEADKFGESGKAEEVKTEVQGKVGEGKDASAQEIADTTKAVPEPAPDAKEVVPMAADKVPGKPGTPNPAQAAPDALPPSVTDMSAGPDQVNQQMTEAKVTEQQLSFKNSREPQFDKAVREKKSMDAHSEAAPDKLRAGESKELKQVKNTAAAQGSTAMAGIHATRVTTGKQVGTGKTGTKKTDEDKRARVTALLQKVFDQTKCDVEKILSDLDKKVDNQFTTKEKRARDNFTSEHEEGMRRYKDERYEWPWGKARWVRDLFAGLPEEANRIYERAKENYLTAMNQIITEIAETVEQELRRAKDRIAAGRKELKAAVDKLPADLKAIGREAASEFEGKFDELKDTVNDKGTELVDTLATKYTEAVKAVDDEIAAEKEKNKGLVAKAADAIGGAIKAIIELGRMLMGVLRKAVSAIGAILKDPIGFLGRLVTGVGGGLKLFMRNAGRHLQGGVLAWLLGTGGAVGLQLPKTFDILGILTLIAMMLGISWANIRARLARRVPNQALVAAETAVPLVSQVKRRGVAGMWDDLKGRVGDLKKTLIKDLVSYLLPTIIIAGITWIVSLFNPASAFIRACKMIIDIIRFIVTNARQIVDFVNAVLDAVIAIARGGTGGVPALVERALARAIPVLIGALAALLGIGGIAGKVKQIFQKIARPVNRAIDWVINKIVGLIKKLWRKLKAKLARKKPKHRKPRKSAADKRSKPDKKKRDKRTQEQQLRALNAGLDAADALLHRRVPQPEIEKRLPGIKSTYKLTKLKLVVDDRREKEIIAHVEGSINPSDRRPQRPIPGLFESIDPSEKGRESFTFKGDEQMRKIGPTEVSLTTTVIYWEGKNKKGEGKVLNSFDITSYELTLKEHFLDQIPSDKRWITAPAVPVVPGRGTRLITYVNLRQLRKFEKYAGDQAVKEVKAELRRQGLPATLDPSEEAKLRKGKSVYGTIKHVTLDNVENIQALLQLHRALNLRPGVDVNQAIMGTSSIPYVSEILAQAGGRIKSARVIGGQQQSVGVLMQHYEDTAPNRLRDGVRARHRQLLADYGVTRQTSILMNFDVRLEIEPFAQGTA